VLTAPLHQRTASIYARRAQIGFVTLGIGATVLAAFALRSLPPVESPSLVIPAPGSGKNADSMKVSRGPEFDASAVARRMAQIANNPVALPKETPEEPRPDPEQPAHSTDSVKFLGAIREPGRSFALLKIGERQRMLGVGETEGDVTVVEVNDDRVEITLKGAVSQTLTKQERTGSIINFVAGATSPNPGGAPEVNIPPGPGARAKRNLGARGNLAGEDPSIIAAREAAEKARGRVPGGEKP
jgi:hypothetical protein